MFGGPAVTIATIPGGGAGASWGDDGVIVYATNLSKGLMRVSEAGGEATQFTTVRGGESHILPEILPGGRAVLYTRSPGALRGSNGQIVVIDLDSGTEKVLISGGSHARYSSSGHLVYGFSGTLRAVAFDLSTLTVRGSPVPVVERVITKPSGATNFAIAADGTLVYESGNTAVSVERSLVWVDRDAARRHCRLKKKGYVYPRISPDGSRVALDIRDADNDVWCWISPAEHCSVSPSTQE